MKLGKREICIYAAVSVVCILMVWLMGRFIFGFWGVDSSEPEAEVVSVVPDGEAEPIHESKSEAYRSDVGRRNESIDDYFGRLAPEGDEEISLVSGEGMPDRSRVGARDDGGGRDDGEGRFDGSGRHCGLDPQSGVGSSPRRNGSGAATISLMSPEEKLEYDRRRAEMVRDVLTDSGIPGQARNDGMPDQVRHDEGGVDNGSVIAGNDPQSPKRPFRCMFVRDEKIKSGQRVAVRLLEEYNDGSIRIPANTHLQAICKLDSRLHLNIRSLEMNGKIIPLQFEAYDTDGLEGIYCPESSKAVKTATNDLITTAGTSLGGLVGNIANTVIRTGATMRLALPPVFPLPHRRIQYGFPAT